MGFSNTGALTFASEITRIAVEQGQIQLIATFEDDDADEEAVRYAKRIALFLKTIESELITKEVR